MTSSGLNAGRPDDIIFSKGDLTPVVIQGEEWLELKISPPLKLGSDTQSSLYIAIDKLNAVFDVRTYPIFGVECLETGSYHTGNKIIYFDTGYQQGTTLTLLGQSGASQRLNFYKLNTPSSDNYCGEYTTLHFKILNQTPVEYVNIKTLLCTLAVSKSCLKNKTSPRPGHARGVTRISPIWN